MGTQESAYPHGKVLQACLPSWAPRTPQGMWTAAGFGSRSSVPRGAFSTSGPIRAKRLQKHSRWRVPAPVTPGPAPPHGLRAEMWVALSRRLNWSVESTQNSPLACKQVFSLLIHFPSTGLRPLSIAPTPTLFHFVISGEKIKENLQFSLR